MGSVVGKVMEKNFKKQQEFMEKNQELMLERQIQMNNQMRERQAAMMVARTRDMLQWWSTFFVTCAVLGLAGARKLKKPSPLIPLIPLSFIVGYQYDLAYGTKLQRCLAEANTIMDMHPELYSLPHDLPTLASIDRERMKKKLPGN